MTGALAERFDRVRRRRRLAGDARAGARRTSRRRTSTSSPSPASGSTASRTGARTRSSATSSSSTCPSRERRRARTCASSRACSRPAGEAFVQLPVLDGGLGRASGARVRGAARRASPARPDARRRLPRLPPDRARARPRARRRRPARRRARTRARPPYRFSRDRFLRLARAHDRRRARRLRRPARRGRGRRLPAADRRALRLRRSACRCTTSSCRCSTAAACAAHALDAIQAWKEIVLAAARRLGRGRRGPRAPAAVPPDARRLARARLRRASSSSTR